MANIIKLKNSGTSSSTPSSLEYGELAINYADGKLFYKNGSGTIVEYGGSAGITVADAEPTGASEGDLWFESDTTDFHVYYDGVWVDVGGSSVANIAVQSAAPSGSVNGDLWLDTDTMQLYVYYSDGTSSQWVEIGAPAGAYSPLSSPVDGAIMIMGVYP